MNNLLGLSLEFSIWSKDTSTGNPALVLFGLDIYYYAILIVTGMILATYLSSLLMRRKNISPDLVLTLFVICIPCAIIGARVFYCITDGYITRGESFIQWISVRDGGLSIIGGLLGGILSGILVCYCKKVSFLRIADCILPTVPLAQAIGRWGNFLNQEVYGTVIANENLHFFPIGVFIEKTQSWHYALFFYEGILNLLWFAILFTLAWRCVKKPNGIFVGMMVAFYGVIRSIMEPFRDLQFILGGEENMWSQISSFAMIGLGLAIIVTVLIINKVKEGKFIGSKRGATHAYSITYFVRCYAEDLPKYDKINAATPYVKAGILPDESKTLSDVKNEVKNKNKNKDKNENIE